MPTVDLNKFDLHMVQMGVSFCIPASAWSIFRYHDPHFPHSQEYILGLMVTGTTDHQPSFGAMVNHVQPIMVNQFTITNPSPGSFQDWCDNIKKEIDLSNPIAIATRVSHSNVHIRVMLGYDDIQQTFSVYNPGSTIFMVNNQITSGSILQIKSGLEEYSYLQASADFHADGAANDQLVIHLV